VPHPVKRVESSEDEKKSTDSFSDKEDRKEGKPRTLGQKRKKDNQMYQRIKEELNRRLESQQMNDE
jgi:chaperonin cofactor prefoldin